MFISFRIEILYTDRDKVWHQHAHGPEVQKGESQGRRCNHVKHSTQLRLEHALSTCPRAQATCFPYCSTVDFTVTTCLVISCAATAHQNRFYLVQEDRA